MTGHQTLEEFCIAVHPLGLSNVQQALAVLWFTDRSAPGEGRSPGELARILSTYAGTEPHSTRLGEAILKTKHAISHGRRLRIRPTSRGAIEQLVASALEPSPPKADHAHGFIPEAVWKGSRGYIEKIARQVNECYQFSLYDGAAVLLRRLIETLLIECFEHANIADEIKKPDGNYAMLAEIISNAINNGRLHLGRGAKKSLPEIKQLGDRSAHERRFTAGKADLELIQPAARAVVEELLHIANPSAT